MPESDYPILGAEIARSRRLFQHPLLTSKPATMTKSAQTYIPFKFLTFQLLADRYFGGG